jgi:hypothetical protein
MFLESLLEFSLCDLMSRGNHGLEILSPYQRCTMELEGSEAGLALFGAGQGEHRELGLNGPDPRIGNQWLPGLFKRRGLHGIEMLIFGDPRLAIDVFPMGIVLQLLSQLLLRLEELTHHLGLGDHKLLLNGHVVRWWRSVTPTCTKTVGGSPGLSHHLKFMRFSLATYSQSCYNIHKKNMQNETHSITLVKTRTAELTC